MNNEFLINGHRPWGSSGNTIVLTGHSKHDGINAHEIKIKLFGMNNEAKDIDFYIRYNKADEGYLLNVIVSFKELPKDTDELKVYHLDAVIYAMTGEIINKLINQISYDIIETAYYGKYFHIKGWIIGNSVLSIGVRYAGEYSKKKLKMDYENFDAIQYHSHVLEAVSENNGFILKIKKPKHDIDLRLSSGTKKCVRRISI